MEPIAVRQIYGNVSRNLIATPPLGVPPLQPFEPPLNFLVMQPLAPFLGDAVSVLIPLPGRRRCRGVGGPGRHRK